MKKKFLILIACLITTFSSSSFAMADYQEALQAYQLTTEKYRNNHQEYISAKNSYLKYKSLNAQQEALIKTKFFLQERDNLLISYYQLLKEKVFLIPGIPPYEKNMLINQLDVRMNQFKIHKESVSAIADINDCVLKSQEIDKISKNLLTETQKIYGSILIGKVTFEAEKYAQTQNQIKEIINLMKLNNNQLTKLERWFLEANYKFELVQQKIEEAKNSFSSLNTDYYEGKNFLKSKQLVIEANQYLKEAVSNAKETVEEIKTGNYL